MNADGVGRYAEGVGDQRHARASALWNPLTVPAQWVFCHWAPLADDADGDTALDELRAKYSADVVDLVLPELRARNLLTVNEAFGTVRLTNDGILLAAHADEFARRRPPQVDLAEARVRRFVWRRLVRRTKVLCVVLSFVFGALGALAVIPDDTVDVQPPAGRYYANLRSLPPQAIDPSAHPPREPALANGDRPTPCEPGSDLLEEIAVFHTGKYVGTMRHHASYTCGGAWFSWENDTARLYHGELRVTVVSNGRAYGEEIVSNDRRVIVGPFVGSIRQCVGFVFYVVLMTGDTTTPKTTACREASPGAGVTVDGSRHPPPRAD